MRGFRVRLNDLRSPGLVLGVVAVIAALSGTAIAAGLITGKDVKNSSLTGIDVKNRSLTARDFRGSVRGPRGPSGNAGATGPTGPGTPSNAAFGTTDPYDDYISATPTDLVSTQVATSGSGFIVATATLNVGGTTNSDMECFINIDGTNVGLPLKEAVTDGFEIVTFTGGGTVATAGNHTVTARCTKAYTGDVTYNQGQITAIAKG
jgi:hypothetical protein